MHGNLLKRRGVICKEMLHVTDWYPTFINLAGNKSLTIGNLRTTTTTLSTTTGSEIQCTAQARLANFVVVVSSTTPNTVQSRRPASQASADINPLFLGDFFSVLCIFCLRKSRYLFFFLITSDVD